MKESMKKREKCDKLQKIHSNPLKRQMIALAVQMNLCYNRYIMSKGYNIMFEGWCNS